MLASLADLISFARIFRAGPTSIETTSVSRQRTLQRRLTAPSAVEKLLKV
jgi:hypothetical protein